jgi:protein-L-isoaspartate(D-aspartate) O-methyltransferase
MDEWAEARAQMVAEQIERRGVRDERVLAAMRRVPRHLFVNPQQQPLAYADRALPIGEGQTISQPYMVAVMTERLAVAPDACVLEIGAGSGYQAAVLAELARQVITIERRADLAGAAEKRLAAIGYHNVTVIIGDGSSGFPARAPYGGIIVTAGAPLVPSGLQEQLAEGARLVVPVGTASQQDLVIIERQGNAFTKSRGEGCVFVPLVGVEGWPETTH